MPQQQRHDGDLWLFPGTMSGTAPPFRPSESESGDRVREQKGSEPENARSLFPSVPRLFTAIAEGSTLQRYAHIPFIGAGERPNANTGVILAPQPARGVMLQREPPTRVGREARLAPERAS